MLSYLGGWHLFVFSLPLTVPHGRYGRPSILCVSWIILGTLHTRMSPLAEKSQWPLGESTTLERGKKAKTNVLPRNQKLPPNRHGLSPQLPTASTSSGGLWERSYLTLEGVISLESPQIPKRNHCFSCCALVYVTVVILPIVILHDLHGALICLRPGKCINEEYNIRASFCNNSLQFKRFKSDGGWWWCPRGSRKANRMRAQLKQCTEAFHAKSWFVLFASLFASSRGLPLNWNQIGCGY